MDPLRWDPEYDLDTTVVDFDPAYDGANDNLHAEPVEIIEPGSCQAAPSTKIQAINACRGRSKASNPLSLLVA